MVVRTPDYYTVPLCPHTSGVGYSYCEAQLGGGACANTDNSTAQAALAGLVDFFQNKFPTLADNPLYVTGESYAGVYVPTLARAILDHNDEVGTFKINLAGLAAGDPCTDNAFQRDSMDMLWYGHKHGFISEADFDLLWNQCKVRYPHPLTRGKWTKAGGTEGGWRQRADNLVVVVREEEEDVGAGSGRDADEVGDGDGDGDGGGGWVEEATGTFVVIRMLRASRQEK